MILKEQIAAKRATIHTDGYPMSIGELVNLYKDGELDVHPEFQRFFRWTEDQRSRLIESLLLGIPIPSIFVQQTSNGAWDVIDGLQRLSTIFQCMGILKDEDGKLIPRLILRGTNYLPALEGKVWSDGKEEESEIVLGREEELLIKRSKLDVKIVLRESDATSKYELFQRLNTGGSPASPQEIRNCILIMVNRGFYQWLMELVKDENFQTCISLTERASEEQYDAELVVRFLTLRRIAPEDVSKIRNDLGGFLTDRIRSFAEDANYDRDTEEKAFRFVFSNLQKNLEENSFKRYDTTRKKFTGSFLISSFEIMALGFGFHYESYATGAPVPNLEEIAKENWTTSTFSAFVGSGISALYRITKILPLARSRFQP